MPILRHSLGEVLDHLGDGETGVYHRHSLTFTLISLSSVQLPVAIGRVGFGDEGLW